MADKLEIAVVDTVQGELSGQLLKPRLEWEGIPVLLKFETYYNLKVGLYNPCTIIVPQSCAIQAREIAANFEYNLINNIPRKRLWIFSLMLLFS